VQEDSYLHGRLSFCVQQMAQDRGFLIPLFPDKRRALAVSCALFQGGTKGGAYY